MHDVRMAVRLAGQRSWLTVCVVLMLSIGIGMSTAVYAVAEHAFFEPLPYADPGSLVRLKQELSGGDFSSYLGSGDMKALQEASRTLDIAAYLRRDVNLVRSGFNFRARCGVATASLFRVLRTRALIGRLFEDMDDQRGAARVVILSREFWMARFGGDPALVGTDVLLDGELHRVVGVLPGDFRLVNSEGDRMDAWIAGALDSSRWASRPLVIVHGIGRMQKGYGPTQVNSELIALKRLQRRRPRAIIAVSWLTDERRLVKEPLLMITAVVCIVLLISCINAANLLLTRAVGRRGEIAVRFALGAGRWRIVRQLLTEGVVLSLSGAVIGLAVSFAAKALLTGYLSSRLPGLASATIGLRAMFFDLLIGIATGALFGIAPALHVAGLEANGAMGSIARGTGGRSTLRLRDGLVVAEVALSVVGVGAAGLLLQSLLRLEEVDCGYQAARVSVGSVDLDPISYASPDRQAEYAERVLRRIVGSAGVISAAASSQVPLGGLIYTVGGLQLQGSSTQVRKSLIASVSPDFFKTLQIPLLAGRAFTASDFKGAAEVAIVNRSFAQMYCKQRDCVGRQVAHWDRKGVWLTIIGVAGDTRFSAEDDVEPEVYRPIAQEGVAHQEFLVRTRGDSKDVTQLIRRAAADADPTQPLHDTSSLEERQNEFMAPRKVMLVMVGVLGVLALGLAAVGTIGVLHQSVSEQRQSIAIRMAVGAGPMRILKWQLAKGVGLIVGGVLIGLAGSLAVSQWIQSELWGVRASDPATWAAAVALIGICGCVACLIPALGASRVQIAGVLRGE